MSLHEAPDFSKLPADIRAEFAAAELISAGLIEQIFFHPSSIFRRNFRKDILETRLASDDTDLQKIHHWELSREGLYDMLPEGVFHQPRRNPYKRKQDMVDEYKRQQAEEKAARTFFLPFEQVFYQMRLLLEMKEAEAFAGFVSEAQQKLWSRFLNLGGGLSQTQLMALLQIMPIRRQLLGDWELTASGISLILGEAVDIRLLQAESHSVGVFRIPALGAANLGVDFVLGEQVNDHIPELELIVGPVMREKLELYLPEGKGRKFLDLLCDYFLPLEVACHIKIVPEAETAAFSLPDDTEQSVARLGYTTVLQT